MTRTPTSLIIVAVLFILGGVSSVYEVLFSLTRGNINLNFGVLGLFIGFGLLRLSSGWRTCALFCTWLGLLLIPIVGLLILNHDGPSNFKFVGQKIGVDGKGAGLVMCIVIFLYFAWQYRVLTRPDVLALFRPPPR